jgi:hypothetical protein
MRGGGLGRFVDATLDDHSTSIMKIYIVSPEFRVQEVNKTGQLIADRRHMRRNHGRCKCISAVRRDITAYTPTILPRYDGCRTNFGVEPSCRRFIALTILRIAVLLVFDALSLFWRA